jgi:hypothetical protein
MVIEVCSKNFNQRPVENFPSGFDEKFSIEVCPEFLDRGPVEDFKSTSG